VVRRLSYQRCEYPVTSAAEVSSGPRGRDQDRSAVGCSILIPTPQSALRQVADTTGYPHSRRNLSSGRPTPRMPEPPVNTVPPDPARPLIQTSTRGADLHSGRCRQRSDPYPMVLRHLALEAVPPRDRSSDRNEQHHATLEHHPANAACPRRAVRSGTCMHLLIAGCRDGGQTKIRPCAGRETSGSDKNE
jgi:hypothetical protein